MATNFHVLTGGTSGMGLHLAGRLAKGPDAHVIVGARHPEGAEALRRAVPSDRLTVLPLDLASLASVRDFAVSAKRAAADGDLCSVICNAGLQRAGDRAMATPKVELTFMVNVLAHGLLVDLLLPDLKQGAHVVTVGSGTHNPDDRIAKLFGFRGAVFPGPTQVISGDLGTGGTPRQLNMDRYAASKLGAIYQAMVLAREVPPETCSFYSFDPGLMPGTALARDRSAVERFGWTHVMPALRHVVSGVSSGEQSAKALVQHCLLSRAHPTGSYIEFTGKPAPRSTLSEDHDAARALITACRALTRVEG